MKKYQKINYQKKIALNFHKLLFMIWRSEKMKKQYIFPCVLILLDLCAAGVCAISRDYKKAIYWIAAAVLNITVTF